MLETHCFGKRGVGLDDDVVGLAERGDGGLGIEGVGFDLVYCWGKLGVGC